MTTFVEFMKAAKAAYADKNYSAAQELYDAALDAERNRLATDPNASPRADGPPLHESGPSQPRDRFGDTFGEMTAPSRNLMQAGVAGVRNPEGGVVKPPFDNRLGDALARAGNAGAVGLGAIGTALTGTAGLAGEVFGGSPTNERMLAGDLMGAMEVAVPQLAGVSGASMGAAKAARAAQALERTPSARQATARAADEMGVTPSLGMTGKTSAMLASGLEKVPFTGTVIAKDALRALSEFEAAATKTIGKIGTPSRAENAGDTLQRGLRSWVDKFKADANALYEKVGEKMPPETRVQIPRTLQQSAEALEAFDGNPELARKLGLNSMDKILGEAMGNGMSWRALSQFRSDVGEAIGSQKGALSNQSDARLRSLYETLTEDMETAVRQAGPEAENAWKRANSFYKHGAERIDKHLDKAITADSPERAFSIFQRITKDGSTADVKRLRAIRESMNREDWGEVAASVVDTLGKAKAGSQNAAGDAFSASTFLTEWNKMTPNAKALLAPPPVRKELEKLARVAEGLKSAGAERNHSNTGTVITQTALVTGGASAAPTTTAAILGGTYLSAKAMTSARMLRALNSSARGDVRQLRALANSKSEFASDAETILRLMAVDTETPAAANTNETIGAVRNVLR